MIMPTTIGRVRFNDVSGGKPIAVSDVAIAITIGELLDEAVIPQMHLLDRDSSGRALEWSPRLQREGRTLHRSETVGEALQEDDEVVLAPNVDAG